MLYLYNCKMSIHNDGMGICTLIQDSVSLWISSSFIYNISSITVIVAVDHQIERFKNWVWKWNGRE